MVKRAQVRSAGVHDPAEARERLEPSQNTRLNWKFRTRIRCGSTACRCFGPKSFLFGPREITESSPLLSGSY